jgi:PIN domain nuclease of toxin-antitoxin system
MTLMATDRLLLDTHTFLWWIQDSKELSSKSRRAISKNTTTCYLSAASVWEMAIKASLGKLELVGTVEQLVSKHLALNGFKLLDIAFRHVVRVQSLPLIHRDPFDRLLITQAHCENLTLVTKNAIFSQYDIELLW